MINPHLGPKDEVIAAELRSVHYFANKYMAAARAEHVEYEDLYQIGCMGLVKAYNEFKPDGGNRFNSFAFTVIQNEIRRWLLNHSDRVKVARHIKELRVKAYRLGIHDEAPELIASRTGCTVKHAKLMQASIQARPTSMDVLNDEGQEFIHDMIGQADDLSAIEVSDFIERLPERLKLVTELRLQGMSQRQIGDQIGINQVTVGRTIFKVRRMLQHA